MGRQQRASFDAISKGHDDALASMGIIQPKPVAAQKKDPFQCPTEFVDVMEIYKELKFSRHEDDTQVATLRPRKPLEWADIAAYKYVTGADIGYTEATALMSIDAIFEGETDG